MDIYHINAKVLWIVILIIQGVWGNIRDSCAGLTTLGYTYPVGDVTLEYGQPLNLTCILYDYIPERDGKHAELFFIKNNETNRLPKEMIEIVNSTSIRLYIERPNQASDDNYVCYYGTNLVCMNVVSVGVKPQNVTDFSCVGRNYENLTCTWTAPNNSVKTNYSLSFRLKGRSSRSPIRCPNITEDKSKMSCVWTISSEPPYRAAQPSYNFSLLMSNHFGNNTHNYQFDHFKHVVPNAPQNLRATALSPHSIQLFWQLPSSMKTFPPGVHHRILYQCEYYEKKWQFGGLITNQTKNENITFVLTNLKYAHALCDIRVSMRSAKADVNDEWAWSENATRTVRTKSKIPDGPPETNIGSFEIVTNGAIRNIYVYWKQIREESRNGQNFQYKVKVENPAITNYSSKSFVELKGLSAKEYKIDIWSQNDEGISLNKSTLLVPARRLPEPQRFMKIAHPDLFELKWDPPKPATLITNYTIFWCRSEYDRPYDCDGYLDWLTVSNDRTQFNLTLPRNVTHQIAISANGLNSSSGMLWAECTIIPGKNVGKLKNIWISNVGSDFIDVEWKMDCSDQITEAQGFIINYCQIEKGQTDCINEVKNITIMNKNEHRGRVQFLKPYRTYQLTVAVIISDSLFSQFSEPMYNTTSEAAPSSPPLNVRVMNITDSFITITWDPPSEINGKLKFYWVHLNGNKSNVEATENNYTFSNLESYRTYAIALEACTVACSSPSKPIVVTTKMGYPGEISKPVILASNSSLITIEWQKPKPPRGKTDYYQLKLAYKLTVTNQTDGTLLNVTNSQNYSTGCNSKKSTFYLSVRAVNKIGTEHKYGPWSEPLQLNNCSSPSQFLYIVIIVVLFIIVIAAVYFSFIKLFFYFKSMKDVQVKLPPGLQTVVDQQPWVSSKHSEDIDRISKPDPDEELLLDKFPDTRLGVDTNVGLPHETMTTSMESSPHLTTDITKKPSLRQRNKGYNAPDAAKVAQSTGNYCVLGVDPNKALNTETRYLPGLDTETPPPTYVTVDDIVKMPNPGYIPFTATESEEKNNGYVMAGMPKDLLVHDLLQCDSQKLFEEKPLYVRASDPLSSQKGSQFMWEQPPLDANVMKSGYVSVGDALPPKNVSDVSKGYVPHRQFDATKSIKED